MPEDLKEKRFEMAYTPTKIELQKGNDPTKGLISGVAAYPTYIEKYDAYLEDGALSGACGLNVPVIYGHNTSEPPFGDATLNCAINSSEVGFEMALDLSLIDGTNAPIFPMAHQSYQGYKSGSIKGVSLGMEVLEYRIDVETGSIYIEKAMPYELSVTPWPAIEGALAKQVLERGKGNHIDAANINEECPCAVALVAELDETLTTLRRLRDD